jgi:hypothetical protein
MTRFAAHPGDEPDLYAVRRPARRATRSSWIVKVVATCAVVAALMVMINLAISWSRVLGDTAGRVTDPTPVILFVGEQRMSVPGNMIRFADQRSAGPHERIDLAVHWPSLGGYAAEHADAFLDSGPDAKVLFLTVRKRATATDSAGRLATIYRHFMDEAQLPAPVGLVGHRLAAESGLSGEEVYFEKGSLDPFTTHCLAPDDSGYPALCLTEVHAGTDLSVQIRFRKGLLGDWAEIKAAARKLLLGFGVVS